MEKSKLILNGIFYIIITIIFIILFVKEKQIGAFIKTNRDKFSDNLVLKLGWEGKKLRNIFKKSNCFYRKYWNSTYFSFNYSKNLFRKFFSANRFNGTYYNA